MRDTVTILGAALITLVAWQMFGGAAPGPAGTGSIQPIETSIDIRTFAVVPTLQPVPTIGLIANPSVGLGATPTPVPFATLRPR